MTLSEQQPIAGEAAAADTPGCAPASLQLRTPDRGQPVGPATGGRELTDEELSRLGGDGIEALFARHHAALYRFCLRYTKQSDVAADVEQTVWERAFVTFSRRGGAVTKVRPWLYAVARNECLDAIRARGATQMLDVSDVELPGGVSPEDSFEQRVELALLLADLAELSERQRSALVLRELAGFEGPQLAGALGTSPPRALDLVAEARRGLIARRSGREMPCHTAQHELKRMRRRSRGVRAHLESCADCQSFERSRRGRSLSSLAVSPVLLAHGLAERLGALAPAAPQGIIKATAATAMITGSIALTHPAAPAVDRAPQKAAITSSAREDAVSAPGRATPDAHGAVSAATGSTRPVLRSAAPRAPIKPRPPAASTRSAGSPAPTAPVTSATSPAPTAAATPAPAPDARPVTARVDASPRAAGDALAVVVPELNASVDATVNETLATTQQGSSSLHSTLDAAVSLGTR